MKQFIYADNAATTKLNREAFEAMVPWLTDEYGNASQPYAFGKKANKAISEAREIIARCINALPEEVYFTSGGTESDNWAIKGSALSDFDKLVTITSSIEHHAVLRACEAIERLGYPVTYLAPDKYGVILPEKLKKIITKNVRLVSIMFSNNEIGTIEPIVELAKVAHKYGALFHTDAVQAIGHVTIDVKKLGVDMLSASAHKFNGPKGVGFLYIRKGVTLAQFNDGGSQEYGKRAGTENISGIVGMATALKTNYDHMKDNQRHIIALEQALLADLNGLDYIRNGSNNRVPGSINLSFKDADGEMLLHRMDLKGICISTGSACDSINTQVSHVVKAIGVPEDYSKGTVRISLGIDNTLDEMHVIANTIKQIMASR